MAAGLRSAAIIGGGIGGMCTAIALRKVGVDAVVYERASALAGAGAGITLWPNAIYALRQLGLADQVIAAGSTIRHAAARSPSGRMLTITELGELKARFGEPAVALHRAELHRILLAALPAGAVILDSACRSVVQDNQSVVANFADGRQVSADLLVGADGIHSAVRQQMFPQARLRYAGYTAWRGVVTTTDEQALGTTSESWGRGKRFGIVPIAAHQIYWFATANVPAGLSQPAEERKLELRRGFGDWHAPIPALIEATPAADILRNDICDVRPFQPWSRGRAVLLGDAAHATTPNLGQGACMAIESAVMLARALDQEPDVELALVRYERERRPRTSWITRTSWQVGRVGQWQNPLACAIRDFLMRMTPESVTMQQLGRAVGYRV